MLGKNLIKAAAAKAQPLYIEDVMSTWLYTGNGSTQTITNGIDLAGEGGLVWTKQRSGTGSNAWVDTVRGAPYNLVSNSTNSEQRYSNTLTGFTSSGYSINIDIWYNTSGATYASWTFRKAEKFFDVVTYTGTGSARTIAHNLGSVPGTIIVKRTDSTSDWAVYHRSLTPNLELRLNSTAAAAQYDSVASFQAWNNTAPTSTVFSVGSPSIVNASGGTYVAYLFAHDAGGFGDDGTESVIKCGSYTGTGAAGNAITLGWEPQWLLVKRTDTTGNWQLADNMRGVATGGTSYFLNPNLANAESGFNSLLQFTATGFQYDAINADWNASGGAYIYIAIRRGPMKTPEDATKVLTAKTRTGTGANTSVTGIGFAPDLVVTKTRTSGVQDNSAFWYDRLRGNYKQLQSATTNAEGGTTTGFALAGTLQETADIVQLNNINRSGDTAVDWFFRRAPGFFDVVAYTGDGSLGNRAISHNLAAPPELLIVKERSGTEPWQVFAAPLGASAYLLLNSDVASGSSGRWGSTFPTSTVFTVNRGAAGTLNVNGDTYIAYLFGTVAGVSKVGSYTGTGTTLQVDCGFASGARFVLIKRTDSSGDWYVWDTARGIVSGNDPYLLLNSTAAEVISTDYIDPYSAGFEISSTAPAAINASGGSYIYLSIA